MATTVYLVRHAQSQPRYLQPECDWELSPTGQRQARALVAILSPLGIEHAYTSPYRRCRDTLAPFAQARGLALEVHDGLRERRLSDEWIQDFREVWQRSWADFSYALAGGECSWTCLRRIASAVEEIVARHPGGTIAVASHGNALGLFLHHVDASCGVIEASALRTPEIVQVTHDGSRFSWNRDFSAGAAFDALATDFRLTPGIVA